MVRVATFCPRCGESIETDVPDEARTAGRAELACPACRFEFIIAPARDAGGGAAAAPPQAHAGRAGDAGRAPAPDLTEAPRAGAAERIGPTSGRPRSMRPIAAALMLFFVAILGLWMGGVFAFTDGLVESGFQDMEGEGVLAGEVHDPDGQPIPDVRIVRLVEGAESDDLDTTTTDADGRYRFQGLPPGVHLFRFEKANWTTVVLETPVYTEEWSPAFGDTSVLGSVTLEPGTSDDERTVSRLDEFERVATIAGWFILTASAVTALGGWACMRRRGFGLALTGAIAGILTFGFIVGSAVSLIALVLVVLSRREFAPLRPQKT